MVSFSVFILSNIRTFYNHVHRYNGKPLPKQIAAVWKDQSLQWSRDQKHSRETLHPGPRFRITICHATLGCFHGSRGYPVPMGYNRNVNSRDSRMLAEKIPGEVSRKQTVRLIRPPKTSGMAMWLFSECGPFIDHDILIFKKRRMCKLVRRLTFTSDSSWRPGYR